MKFDYIDIGTSDFDTSLDLMKEGEKILLIEPVKYYFDNIQLRPGVYKINCAVSNKSGHGKIFYVNPQIIKKYGMPDWIRGCNSFNKSHETVLRFFREKGLLPEIECESVGVLSFKDIVKLFKIISIGFLKIDTEGHDHIILEDVFKCIKKD